MSEKRQDAQKERMRRRQELVERIVGSDHSDVDGSYTGISEDGSEPVQDADDL